MAFGSKRTASFCMALTVTLQLATNMFLLKRPDNGWLFVCLFFNIGLILDNFEGIMYSVSSV